MADCLGENFFLEFIPLKDLVFGENLLHVHFATKLIYNDASLSLLNTKLVL